jgi:hypothetical protein
LGPCFSIDGIRFAVFHQHLGEVVRRLRMDHHERHPGIVKGDEPVEVSDPRGFQTDDDAGHAEHFLHQAGAVSRGVGEFLRLARGSLLAEGQYQFFRANVHSGEGRL